MLILVGVNTAFHFPARDRHARRSMPVWRATGSQYLNNQTAQFVVNGTNIPLYPYDLGESYAGLLPIAQEYRVDPNGTDAREFFFWFFPSDNPAAAENGPFLRQPATARRTRISGRGTG
ncbi:hypothetical protein DFH07DRAFT_773455 [Mycena maculata]|uniref:Uncharacterized protein n=1 Tax=Mycena maculata TaxID=230809 RepID=A0AAD7J2B8_9AGAR|nr:hypothetical protein DFH07DRAFT_773455 [Mycena maculata]